MSEQIISDPNERDLNTLDQQRQIVARYLDSDGLSKFETPSGKLGTLRALLEADVFSSDQTYELQCMGIVFGDVFVQDMGFHWVFVEDEYGRDAAIQFEDTSIIAYPLTMISKRIERGESVDVFDLYNELAGEMTRLIEEERSR